jgi:tetratricopeptide (TPR) repeat protein
MGDQTNHRAGYPYTIPDRVLHRAEFEAACATHDWATIFHLVKWRGPATHTVLAAAIGTSPNRIGDYIHGRRSPKELPLIERIADGLGIPGHLLHLPTRPWEKGGTPQGQDTSHRDSANTDLTPDDQDRLALAVSDPHRTDATVVDTLSVILAAQRRLEDEAGSLAVLGPTRAQLAVVESMAAQARTSVRPAVLDQIAEWAQFRGWLESNTGDRQAARACFLLAGEAASESRNRDMAATVLSWRGHLAWHAERIPEMIGTSRAAAADPQAAPALRAFARFQEARGHAITAEVETARRVLDSAIELGADAAAHPETTPSWGYYYNAPGFWDMQRGMILRRLGDAESAAAAFRQGAASLPEQMRGADWAGFFRFELALAHVQAGDPEAACAAAAQAAKIAEATSAGWLLDQVRQQLHPQLAHRWPGVQAVSDLGEMLAG